VETLERKSLLYRSGLGFWCINPVLGCAHGCSYPCYAFMMARQHGRTRDMLEWRQPKLVRNAPELLDRELSRKRKVDCVHLCLTTDPFMVGYPEVAALSLRLVEIVNGHGLPASILTKGVLPVEPGDARRFRQDNTYGFSLVSLSEVFRRRYEPGAAPYAARIAAARALGERGFATRVHMEPYPTPGLFRQDLQAILDQIPFVRSLFLGGWNYNPRATQERGRDEFYAAQRRLARRFCEQHGIACEISV
jgi:DNA repair photolyase